MARLEAERLEFKEAKSTLDPPRTLTSIAPACAAPPCQTTAVPASSASQKLTTDPGPGKATVTRPSAASATWQPLFSGWSTLTACTRRALKRQDAALPKEQTAQLAPEWLMKRLDGCGRGIWLHPLPQLVWCRSFFSVRHSPRNRQLSTGRRQSIPPLGIMWARGDLYHDTSRPQCIQPIQSRARGKPNLLRYGRRSSLPALAENE
jgi:hypothetical protein